MSEKQFSRLVNETAPKNAKANSLTHDASIHQLLERRCDTLLVRVGLAKTIMQARQMITHGHWLLNGKKHNIPSYFVKQGDVLTLRSAAQNSPLYTGTVSASVRVPFWITWNPSSMSLELNQMPSVVE
jgi:small subunit ribosomal protein S4